MVAVVLVAGYVAAGAIAGLPPFPRHPAVATPAQLLLTAMPGVLRSHPEDCHSASPRLPWPTVGMDVALRCADKSLPGGQVDGYHFDSSAALSASWQSFNKWWGFSADTAKTGCPPSGKNFGWLPNGNGQIECGLSPGGASSATYAVYIPASDSFVITQAPPGQVSFTSLITWMTRATWVPALSPGVKPLKVLLPTDIQDASTECATQAKIPWTNPGLVNVLECTASDLPNGEIFGYQLDNAADYNRAWNNYNTWANFGVSSSGNCPPDSGLDQGGPAEWYGPRFAKRAGQVLECFSTNSGPVYVWTYPSEDAFMVVQPDKSWTFSKLETWWENTSV
jgi:hypothetical protein